MKTLILKESVEGYPDTFAAIELPVTWRYQEGHGKLTELHNFTQGTGEYIWDYIQEHCYIAHPHEYSDIPELWGEPNTIHSVEDAASVLELFLDVVCDTDVDKDGATIEIHYDQISHSHEPTVELFEHIVFNTEDISIEDVSIYLSADTSGISYFRQMNEGWNVSIIVTFIGYVRLNTYELTKLINTVKRFKNLIDLMGKASDFNFESDSDV